MKKKLLKIITVAIFLLLAIVIIYMFKKYDQITIDAITRNQIAKLINNTNTVIAKIFTFLGSTLFITTACVISIFFKKYRFSVPLNAIIMVTISETLKKILKRARPTGIALIKETGFSFPSGHSIVSFAFYGFIIYLIYKSSLKKPLKISLITLLALIILMIGLSRIYLGVHYTTDVIGGYALALVHLIIYINLIYKKYIIKEK